MSEPDWRKILIAYIGHVRACEGITFLPEGPSELEGLSAEECGLLNEAAIEAIDPKDIHAVRALREAAAQLRGGKFS